MKNKFTKIILCLLLCFSFVMVAGCDLFPRNVNDYLEKSVCTITYENGKKEEITTEEFIEGYNSYGSSLVENGTEYKEAAKQTIQLLANRKILIDYAKNVKNVEFDADDKKEMLDTVYSSLKSAIDSYATSVREEWNIEEPVVPEDEDKNETVVYTAYEQKAKVVLVGGEYKIELIEEESKQSTDFESLEDVKNAIVEYGNPTDTTNNARIKKEAYRRFIARLKSNENGRNLSKDVESILNRYIEKVYKNAQDNMYTTKVEEFFKVDDKYSTITVRQVLNKYKTMLMQSKFKYESNKETYDTAMVESFSDVNYVVDDSYFFVSHILIKFSDAEADTYKNLSNDAYITRQAYNEQIKSLIAGLKVKVNRDSEGKDTEDYIYASKVLENLTTEYSHASSDDEKVEIFKNYMYKYGEDTGVQNAEYMYVIGKDNSQMVESFTEEARKLDNEGVFAGISTEFIVSEYGVHILFYGGKVENLFTITDYETFNLKDEDIEVLTNAKLSIFNNKTVFDKVFESLSEDGYSVYENMQLNVIKKNIKIELHKSVYENI